MPLVLCTYLILYISQKCQRMLEEEENLEITPFNLGQKRKLNSSERGVICPEPPGAALRLSHPDRTLNGKDDHHSPRRCFLTIVMLNSSENAPC